MSDFDLSKISLDRWWKLLAAAGAAMAIAATAAKFTPGLLIGLGLMLIGVGEWINRAKRTEVYVTHKIESYPWKARLLGLFCDGIGIGLAATGLYRILLPA